MFKDRWGRLLQATQSTKDSELARALGITHQALKGSKNKEKIPGGWIKFLAEECAVSADWLLFGTGQMYRQDHDAGTQAGRLGGLFARASERELAQFLGLEPERVRRLASGDEELSVELATAIADHFNVRPGWLLTGEGPMRPGDVPYSSQETSGGAKSTFAQDVEAMEQALRRTGASDEEIRQALLSMAGHYGQR